MEISMETEGFVATLPGVSALSLQFWESYIIPLNIANSVEKYTKSIKALQSFLSFRSLVVCLCWLFVQDVLEHHSSLE